MLPASRMIFPVDLYLPRLPRALEGLRIAHLSDLHIRSQHERFRRLGPILANLRVDLAFITGDVMSFHGSEVAALRGLTDLIRHLHPRLGIFGVFGNHDTAPFRRACLDLPVHWLINDVYRIDQWPIEILGFDCARRQQPDTLATVLPPDRYPNSDVLAVQDKSDVKADPLLRLLLCHIPTFLPTAADMGIDVMFSGHTHGGQWRLPWRRALYNSCDLPLHLSSGLLRMRNTLGAVSRGLGEVYVSIRLFCPPHLPVYTLRRGPMAGIPTEHILNVQPW